MNREQRRRQAKENGTNANSKKNFVPMGTADISMKELKHDANLKEYRAYEFIYGSVQMAGREQG